MTDLDLSGTWLTNPSPEHLPNNFAHPQFDDSGWAKVSVPAPATASPQSKSEGHSVLLRRSFTGDAPEGERSWLVFDGLFPQASVWFDNSYRGEVDGYFITHAIEVTDAVVRGNQHVVALEATACTMPDDIVAPVPTGVWAPVRLVHTGTVRIARLKVLCSEANSERALLTIRAELDTPRARNVRVRTRITGAKGVKHAGVEHELRRGISTGANRLRWTVSIDKPQLWWPWEIGKQPMFDVTVEVFCDDDESPSDSGSVRTGLRRITFGDGTFNINGERLFIRGIDGGELSKWAGWEPAGYKKRLTAAKAAGVNALYLDSWIAPPAFYDAADQVGMFILQTIPKKPVGGRLAPSPRLVRQGAEVLGHHPSVAAWVRPHEKASAVRKRLQSLTRATDKADSSRPSITTPVRPSDHKGRLEGVLAKMHGKSRLVMIDGADANEIAVARLAKYAPASGLMASSSHSDALKQILLTLDPDATFKVGDNTFGVHLVNDSRVAITEAVVRGTVTVGEQTLEWTWGGDLKADSVAQVGQIRVSVPEGTKELVVSLALEGPGQETTRTVTYAVQG